jgi:ATP-binding cassette subfamily B protein
MFITDVRLALLALGFLAVASVISAYIGKSLPELQQDVQSSKATLNVRLHEALAGIRLVKAFGRERHEIGRMDEAGRRVAALETQGGRVESYLVPILELMEILGVVLVIWCGAHLLATKEITPGNLVAFLAYSASPWRGCS